MRESKSLRSALLLSLLFPGSLAAISNDFSAYPSAAQSCLYSAATGSGCNGDTVPLMNACLCGDVGSPGWVTLSAQCLGKDGVDSTVIANTYSQMSINCGDSSTPLGLTREQFFNYVNSASSSTSTTTTPSSRTTSPSKQTTATGEKTTVVLTVSGSATTLTTIASATTTTGTSTSSTASSTSTETPSPSGGLSSNAKIGIIAGCVGVAVIGIVAAVYFIMRRRLQAAKKAQVEAHPMLGQQPTVFPPADPALPSQTPPNILPSSHSSPMYGGSPAPSSAMGMYKEDDKWRQSGAWTTPQGYQPQTQWGQQGVMQNQMPPQGQMPQGQMQPGVQGAYVPTTQAQPTQFAAELPDSQNHQLYELGDSTPQGPYQARK